MKKLCTVLIAVWLILLLSSCASDLSHNNQGFSFPQTEISNASAETTETTQEHRLSEDYTVLATGYEDNGDIYELVGEQNETSTSGGVKIGVIKNNEWLLEMTSEMPFINESGYIFAYAFDNKNLNELQFEYASKGIFFDQTGYNTNYNYGVIYNSETGDYYEIPGWDITRVFKYNGYKLNDDFVYKDYLIFNRYQGNDSCLLNLDDFSIVEIPYDIKPISVFSEGLFAAYYDNHSKIGFFDEDLDLVLELNYNDINYLRPIYFFNGEATIEAKSPSGKTFVITIDHDGNVISEIEKSN